MCSTARSHRFCVEDTLLYHSLQIYSIVLVVNDNTDIIHTIISYIHYHTITIVVVF